MKRVWLPFLFIIVLSSFVVADGDEGDSCMGDEDCFGVFLCENGVCISPSDEVSEETDEKIFCVAHDDCVLGYACDYSTYSCASLASFSVGSCIYEECDEEYSCYSDFCIPDVAVEEAGITQDNPFLGWGDGFIDTLRSKTTSDPEVLRKISEEALQESHTLDERKATGKLSDDGQRIAMSVKKGDIVLFTKYGPNEIKVEEKEYLIAREEDILAILE